MKNDGAVTINLGIWDHQPQAEVELLRRGFQHREFLHLSLQRRYLRRLADKLEPLAKAGVPILHVCGSLDPWLDRETRLAEKNYKALGGDFTVIIRQGKGYFPTGAQDPRSVVDFIVVKSN